MPGLLIDSLLGYPMIAAPQIVTKTGASRPDILTQQPNPTGKCPVRWWGMIWQA
jgi:hypothetical protein